MEIATDDQWLPDGLIGFSNTIFEFHSLNIQVSRFGDVQHVPEPKWDRDVCRRGSKIYNFEQTVRDLIHDEMKSRAKACSFLPGMIARHESLNFQFDVNEMWVGDWNISHIHAVFDYSVTNLTAKLVSKFSIENKGRFAEFVFDPSPLNDDDIRIEVLGKS